MSAYVMTMNSVYPYVSSGYPKVRVVEETVEEYFDEDGKLTSRTKKTVTRYEEQQTYQAQWYSSDINVLPCATYTVNN